MNALHPQFIKDANGNNSMVVLPIEEYDSILEELEDLEDIMLYDEAMLSNDASIPIDEAFRMIDAERKDK